MTNIVVQPDASGASIAIQPSLPTSITVQSFQNSAAHAAAAEYSSVANSASWANTSSISLFSLATSGVMENALTASLALTAYWSGLLGIPIGLVSSSVQLGIVNSSSYAFTASYAQNAGGGTWGEIVGKPTGLVSSSAQIVLVTSASSADNVQWTNVTAKPVGLISASAQVSFTGISNIPIGIVSSSTQIPMVETSSIANAVDWSNILNTPPLFSSSLQLGLVASSSYAESASWAPSLPLTWDNVLEKPTGLVSSSTQITSVASSSFATSASYVPPILRHGVASASLSQFDGFRTNVGIVSTNNGLYISATSPLQFGLSPAIVRGAIRMSNNGVFVFSDSSGSGSSTTPQIVFGSAVAGFPSLERSGLGISFREASADNPIPISASSFLGRGVGPHFIGTSSHALTADVAISASWAPSAEGEPVNWNSVLNKPEGIVSSSTQIPSVSFAANVVWEGVNNKPEGLISSSLQLPTGIVSSSSQIPSVSFASNVMWDGVNNKPIGIVSSSAQVVQVATSSLALTASYALNGGGASSWDDLTGKPSGIVSSSTQIPSVSFASNVMWDGVNNKPTGLVSSSAQIPSVSFATNTTWNGVNNKPIGIVSSSAQIVLVASASSADSVQWTNVTAKPIGLFSSSVQVLFEGISNIPIGIVSSSIQINTGSYTGSFYGDGAGITNIPINAAVSIEPHVFIGDGIESAYTLSQSYDAETLLVSVNGLTYQTPNDYTFEDDIITFIAPPPSESVVAIKAVVNTSDAVRGTFSGSFIGHATLHTVREEVAFVDGPGTMVFDYNDSNIFFVSSLVNNETWNVINVPTSHAKAYTFTFFVTQSATPYSASIYQINSNPVDVRWAETTVPTGSADSVQGIGLTAIRSGSSWVVLGSANNFYGI